MVVADDDSHGQPRKRPRLSLKSKGKNSCTATPASGVDDSQGFQGTTPQDISERSEETGPVQTLDGSPSEELADQSESFAPDEGPTVPPVASLENLGNTCFLNSVLQILRYTPGFLDGLGEMYREIIVVEKTRKQHYGDGSEGDEEKDPPLSLELVKQLFKLYKNMEKREERYCKIASADVTSMAVKPDKVLDIIREFNPMFEGNLQHDAQELLRCLLCYLEDAEKELHQAQTDLIASIPISQMPLLPAPVNPIMQRFLAAGKKREKPSATVSTPPVCGGGDACATELVKSQLCNGDMTDEVDGVGITNGAIGLGDSKMCELSAEGEKPLTTDKSRKRRRSISRSQPSPQKEDSGSNKEAKSCQAEVPKFDSKSDEPVKTGRKRRSKGKDEPGKENCQQNGEAEKEGPAKRSRKKKKEDNSMSSKKRDASKETNSDATDNGGDKSQPSILSMFSKSGRRLGMRGRVVRKGLVGEKTGELVNNIKQEPLSMDCGADKSDEEEVSFPKLNCPVKSEVKSPSKLSQDFSKMSCKSPMKSQERKGTNDVKQPMLKLEKCDHVCNSPLKSVKATVAMNILTPAIRKVNFDVDEAVDGSHSNDESDDESLGHLKSVPVKPLSVKVEKCDRVCDSPKKSVSAHLAMKYLSGHKIMKLDFVEKLFQGTMMLRTRCLECEFFRERREEFQDVSVPLRREQENDDEDDKDEDSDDDDSCLSKLMSAFTEVERLRDDNKYFCDMCRCYVEAERSLHYDKLPDILTLHLKRFSASSGLFGCVSKINDHVTIPLSLPCLRYKCPKPCCRPDHRYNLYGLVTHAGVTISSGHYLSYVRVDTGPDTASSHLPLASFIKSDWSPVKGDNPNTSGEDDEPSTVQWFECDDESIRIHSDRGFRTCLTSQNSSLLGTPYVLFYQRVTLT